MIVLDLTDDITRGVAAQFAFDMYAGRTRATLEEALVNQLVKHLDGVDDDLTYRRTLLFDGLNVLGSAGLPIIITDRLGYA